MAIAQSSHILGYRGDLQARDNFNCLAPHSGKIFDPLVDFTARHFVLGGMSQHCNTTGAAYPVHYLREVGPLLFNISGFAGA